MDLLEIGSYTGIYWIDKKVVPKRLTCINIAQKELDLGLSKVNDLHYNVDFKLMDANNLTFNDQSFDAVFGGAILHHLDIEKAIDHIYRVLRPGGMILFLEPQNRNPIFRLYRRFNPRERTPDEHALIYKDIRLINSKFILNEHYLDFFSVLCGFISLKLFGDKNYDNWINKFGFKLDVLISKISLFNFLFARVILVGTKK